MEMSLHKSPSDLEAGQVQGVDGFEDAPARLRGGCDCLCSILRCLVCCWLVSDGWMKCSAAFMRVANFVTVQWETICCCICGE